MGIFDFSNDVLTLIKKALFAAGRIKKGAEAPSFNYSCVYRIIPPNRKPSVTAEAMVTTPGIKNGWLKT